MNGAPSDIHPVESSRGKTARSVKAPFFPFLFRQRRKEKSILMTVKLYILKKGLLHIKIKGQGLSRFSTASRIVLKAYVLKMKFMS